MDDRPFLVLDLADIDETILPELRKLTKEAFDLDSIYSAAEELKYVGAIKREIAAMFREPDESFVRLFTSRVYDGRFTQDTRQQFTALVEKASKQFLNEQVNDRLKAALGASYSGTSQTNDADTAAAAISSEAAVEEDLNRDTEIETTLEEIEGYQIVKAIACSEVKPERVAQRDAKSYFAVLLDDNNRKPIARLHFNGKSKKYIGLFDENKHETRFELDGLESIYTHAESIRDTVRRYAD